MTQDSTSPPQPDPSRSPWNPNDLQEPVKRLHGAKRAQDTLVCGQSIWSRMGYMEYHYDEVQRLVGRDFEAPTLEVVRLLFCPNSDAQARDLRTRKFEAQAHLVAFTQCGHAVLDNLGFLIYSALSLVKPRPSEVTLAIVGSLLPASVLKERVQDIHADPEIKHLTALVNHSKHRSVIGAHTSISFVEDGGPPAGLKFGEFTYKGREDRYPARWADEFMRSVYDRLKHHVVRVGHALDAHLADVAETPPRT